MLRILKRNKKPTTREIVNQVLERMINENNKKTIDVPETRRGHYVTKGLALNDAWLEINEVLNRLKIK